MDSNVVIIFFAVLGSFTVVRSAKTCPGTAKYVISFYSNWSGTTHPGAFPSGAHFSPLIGCSHGSNYSIFSSSIKATPGVEEVAETGGKTSLVKEINDKINRDRTAWNLFQASAALYPPEQTDDLEFQVTSDFSKVSAISMIAPSPDWFVGIQSFDLCDADGRWITSHAMTDLQPWDAGTEEGTTFSLTNDPTDPKVNIFQITKDMSTPFKGAESIPSLGRIMLRRIDEPSPTSCSGEAKYQLKFDALWSKATHPTDFPSDPHFSPLIGATHKYTYKFWSEFVRASPGVKEVAEKGNPLILETEINSTMPECVYKVIKTGGPIDSPGTETVNVTVKNECSMLSVISMIARSPDWFVGVDSLDLCSEGGRWKDSLSVNLVAWDAGTDSGTNFTSGNDPTDPVDVVRQITKDSDTVFKGSMTIPFFGKFTLTRYDSDSMPTTAPTTNSATVSAAQLAFISFSLFQVAALRAIL